MFNLEKNVVDPPHPHSKITESLVRVEQTILTVFRSMWGSLNYKYLTRMIRIKIKN